MGPTGSGTSFRWRGPYGEGVGLRVEDILVQTEQLQVIREEQEQVFQGLTQEEALHLVPGGRVRRVADVVDGGVAPTRNLRAEVRGFTTQRHFTLLKGFSSKKHRSVFKNHFSMKSL